MAVIEDIESIPDPGRTIEGLRDTGYNFETAVADLVDNSIAAAATVIDIQLLLGFRGNVRLSIADNGGGMDREGLIQAMRYGSPQRPDPASLGKYGLGLKTASTAFCRRLSLISRASAADLAVMATWDLDHVVTKQSWLLQMSEEPNAEALEHLEKVAPGSPGTVVLWEKVDRLLKNYVNPAGSHANKAIEARQRRLVEHLGMTYQRFLDKSDDRARSIDILVNGQRVAPWDPFQRTIAEVVAEEDVEVVAEGDVVEENAQARFQVRAYILPRREEFPDDKMAQEAKLSSDMQGIYIYREQRLIHQADWLGMFQKEPHGALLRVEFSFDHMLDNAFNLDIKKSQIILNDKLWDWLKDQFLTAPRREANLRYRRGRQKDVFREATGTHDASNNSIRDKEAEIGGPEVTVINPDTGEVTINNTHGEFRRRLRVRQADRPGEVFVQPAQDVNEGLLFEPAIIDGCKAVRINIQHPYYHKVYIPNRNDSVTIQGMDSLLWALCVAEHSATTDRTQQAFEAMRYEMTRILRKLVESLPDPEIGDDAAND